MKQYLHVLCGPPASGKTTWATNYVEDKFSCAVISRDGIRNSILGKYDNYFDKEDKVFKIYIEEIQKCIDNKIKNIVCDATHLTETSRNKLLDNLNLSNINTIIIHIFKTDLNTCLDRNEQRKNKTPRGAVRRMYYSFEDPKYDIKYRDKYIIKYHNN